MIPGRGQEVGRSLHCFQNDRIGKERLTFTGLVAELKSLVTVMVPDLAFLCKQIDWQG